MALSISSITQWGYIDNVGAGAGFNSGLLNPYHMKKLKISTTEKIIHLKTYKFY
jgi:hypothetical protein